MSKANKPVSGSDKVADKLRDSLDMEDNKPDTISPILASPVTPLQTQSSGLTSAATTSTTSSNSSTSSGSFLYLAGKKSIIRKSSSGQATPSAAQSSKPSAPSVAQSGSSNQAGAQLKSSSTSASQSSKPSAPSAVQSGSAAQTSKPNIPSGVKSSSPPTPSAAQTSKSSIPSTSQSKPNIPSGAKSSSPPTPSAAQVSKSGIPSTSKSKPNIPSGAKSSSPPTPSSAKSKASGSAAAQPGSTSNAGGKTGPSSSSPKTKTGNVNAGRGSAMSDSATGTAKTSSKKSSTAPPEPIKIPPGGNLFPSGIVKITGMTQAKSKSTVLGGFSTKSYGYGNIMRGKRLVHSKATTSGSSSSSQAPDTDILLKTVLNSSDPEEVKRIGNEMFRKGSFNEALKLYDRAIQLSPKTITYHSNRAAALSRLNRIGEAVIECEEAIKLDPKFVKAHHRLASLLLRLGQVDNAGMHFFCVDDDPSDSTIVNMLELVDKHLNKCIDARRQRDWEIVFNAATAAMEDGADASPQLAMCKVEALLKLNRLDEAQATYAIAPIIEPFPPSFSQTRFFDMTCEAYKSFVKSLLELALGRFENAVTAAEKASDIDPKSSEIRTWYKNVKVITRERNRGNYLYESERYTEASSAYNEGLKYEPYNSALLCHRGDCSFKVGKWESAVEDYSRSLVSLPSYIKPRLQRAASFGKLEKWAEAVSDYETLKTEMPFDKELAESLFHAQVELKKSRGEVILNMEFSGVVEEMTTLFELKNALTRPGVTILYFLRESDQQCIEMIAFMDSLCISYPSVHFLKVEISKYPLVGESERVRVVPTFKIYKNGIRLKEIVCPSKFALEASVRQYSQ